MPRKNIRLMKCVVDELIHIMFLSVLGLILRNLKKRNLILRNCYYVIDRSSNPQAVNSSYRFPVWFMFRTWTFILLNRSVFFHLSDSQSDLDGCVRWDEIVRRWAAFITYWKHSCLSSLTVWLWNLPKFLLVPRGENNDSWYIFPIFRLVINSQRSFRIFG